MCKRPRKLHIRPWKVRMPSHNFSKEEGNTSTGIFKQGRMGGSEEKWGFIAPVFCSNILFKHHLRLSSKNCHVEGSGPISALLVCISAPCQQGLYDSEVTSGDCPHQCLLKNRRNTQDNGIIGHVNTFVCLIYIQWNYNNCNLITDLILWSKLTALPTVYPLVSCFCSWAPFSASLWTTLARPSLAAYINGVMWYLEMKTIIFSFFCSPDFNGIQYSYLSRPLD